MNIYILIYANFYILLSLSLHKFTTIDEKERRIIVYI